LHNKRAAATALSWPSRGSPPAGAQLGSARLGSASSMGGNQL